MVYSGVVRWLLISAPGDVSNADLATVQRAINRWNGVYARGFATAIIPISWGAHAAAEFGSAPQEIINRQLVDSCDICIAIFASRLGTKTENAESGTAEEVERLHEAGKFVGVLRCRRPVDPGKIDSNQIARLDEYLDRLRSNALVLEYQSASELIERVDTILAAAVSRDNARSDVQLELETGRVGISDVAEVWPRVERSERPVSAGSRIRIQRDWYITLHNVGSAPARNVKLETAVEGNEGENWQILNDTGDDAPLVAVLAPGGDARFVILAHMGIAPQVSCRVTWEDGRGPQENTATLRL